MSVKAYMYDVPQSKSNAPSYRTGANELQALEAVTTCVPDTIMTEAPGGSRPSAATVSFGLLEGALASQTLGTSPIKVRPCVCVEMKYALVGSLTRSGTGHVHWEMSLQAFANVVRWRILIKGRCCAVVSTNHRIFGSL